MDYLDQDLGQSLMVSHQDLRICSTSLLEGQGQCLDHMAQLALTCPQALVCQVDLE